MICPLVGRRLWATMRSMVAYTKAAVERAMQVQEVILRAMAKRITWWQAAEIIGISDRSMRRWRERYKQHGYDGLMDRRRGMPSGKRVPLAQVDGAPRLRASEPSASAILLPVWGAAPTGMSPIKVLSLV